MLPNHFTFLPAPPLPVIRPCLLVIDRNIQILTMERHVTKGPVKLMQWVKIAHSFLQSFKSVPRYHFKLAYVVPHIAVKDVFETYFQKWRNKPFQSVFTYRIILADLEMSLIHYI